MWLSDRHTQTWMDFPIQSGTTGEEDRAGAGRQSGEAQRGEGEGGRQDLNFYL
jgi:hypothetical protein